MIGRLPDFIARDGVGEIARAAWVRAKCRWRDACRSLDRWYRWPVIRILPLIWSGAAFALHGVALVTGGPVVRAQKGVESSPR